MNEFRRDLIRSLAATGPRLSIVPEPEVIETTLAQARCNALADLISSLLAEYEPLLKAEADGATVTVRDLGSGAKMRVRVEIA